jgi:hypothetical protein
VFLDHLPIMLVEIIPTKVLIGVTMAQEMIDDDENTVANRHSSSFGSASCRDATILSRQIGILAMGSGMRSLD